MARTDCPVCKHPTAHHIACPVDFMQKNREMDSLGHTIEGKKSQISETSNIRPPEWFKVGGKIEYSEETEQRQREKHFCLWIDGFLTANGGESISKSKVEKIESVFKFIVRGSPQIVCENPPLSFDDLNMLMKEKDK